MSASEYLGPLIGRLVLAWFFFAQVAGYGGNWDATITLMTFQGVPAAPFILTLTLALVILGSVSLTLGFYTRYGAMTLFAVTIIVTALTHDYWQIHDNAIARQADFDIFAVGCCRSMMRAPTVGNVAFGTTSVGPKRWLKRIARSRVSSTCWRWSSPTGTSSVS